MMHYVDFSGGALRAKSKHCSTHPITLPADQYVKFVNGALSKWQYHTGKQLLLPTEGTGFVEFRDLPDVTLREGDRVFVPADVWHRHGAAAGETLIHLAVTIGETKWDKNDPCNKHHSTGD